MASSGSMRKRQGDPKFGRWSSPEWALLMYKVLKYLWAGGGMDGAVTTTVSGLSSGTTWRCRCTAGTSPLSSIPRGYVNPFSDQPCVVRGRCFAKALPSKAPHELTRVTVYAGQFRELIFDRTFTPDRKKAELIQPEWPPKSPKTSKPPGLS